QAEFALVVFAPVSLFGLAVVPPRAALPSTIAPASVPAERIPGVAAAPAAGPTTRPPDPVWRRRQSERISLPAVDPPPGCPRANPAALARSKRCRSQIR